MPVNEKIESGDLVEQGWSKMLGVLDREMPLKRTIWWGFWIPLSLLSIALISMALWYFPSDKTNEAKPVEQVSPIQSFAQSDNNASSNGANPAGNRDALLMATEKSATKSHIEEVEKNTLAKLSANETAATGKDIVKNEDLVGLQSNVQKTEYFNDDLNADGFTPKNGTSELVIDLNANENALTLNDEEEVNARTDILREEAVLRLPERDMVDVASLDFGVGAKPIIPAATQIRPRVGLEVFGAPHFVSPVELYGLEAGALASVTLGRRWKMLAGVSYGHYNRSGLVSVGARLTKSDSETIAVPVLMDTTSIGSPTYDPTIAYGQIGYDTAQLLSEKFNYLHLPVTAQYRLGRFISVTGGIKVSYLLNAPSGKSLGVVPLNSSTLDLMDLSNSRNFLVEEDILRKWDIAPMVGLAFDVGRRLAMDVQYQHGLIPYVDRETESERSDYHRSVSLGLRFRIL